MITKPANQLLESDQRVGNHDGAATNRHLCQPFHAADEHRRRPLSQRSFDVVVPVESRPFQGDEQRAPRDRPTVRGYRRDRELGVTPELPTGGFRYLPQTQHLPHSPPWVETPDGTQEVPPRHRRSRERLNDPSHA